MKKIVIIIVAIFVAASAVYFWHPWQKVALAPTLEGGNTYISNSGNFSFNYPDGYFIEEKQFDDGHMQIILTEDTVGNADIREGRVTGGEGPTAITFAVYQNQSKISAVKWAQQNQDSNFHLKIGDYTKAVIDDIQGITYRADGLYVSDNIIVVKDASVILAAVTYITLDDQIRKDFDQIIKTFSFGK